VDVEWKKRKGIRGWSLGPWKIGEIAMKAKSICEQRIGLTSLRELVTILLQHSCYEDSEQ